MEHQAQKVERRVRKSVAAALMAHRIGERFDGVITKVTSDGAFIHVFHPPVEGMIVSGVRGQRVGDKVHARLLRVDVERSHIDFAL
jgi:exoribonuclease-2